MDLAIIVFDRHGGASLRRCLQSVSALGAQLLVGLGPRASNEQHRMVADAGGSVVELDVDDRADIALNALLSRVERTWTLRLDSDMWLESSSIEDLECVTERNAHQAYDVLITDHVQDGEFRYSYQPLLYSRLSGLSYRGRIFEILCDEAGLPATRPERIQYEIHRDRYLNGADPEEVQAELALVQKELQDGTDPSYYQGLYWLLLDRVKFHSRLQEVTAWLLTELGAGKQSGDPTVSVARKVLEVSRGFGDGPLSPELVELLDCLPGDHLRFNWELAIYFDRVGDFQRAFKRLRLQMMQAVGQAINFQTWFDPAMIGRDLYRSYHAVGQNFDIWAYLPHDQYARLDMPLCRPNFTTEIRQGSLWMERWVWVRMMEVVDVLGFRPRAYPLQQALNIASAERKQRTDVDWWQAPAELTLTKHEALGLAALLDKFDEWPMKFPLTWHSLAKVPPYTVVEGPSRFRRAARELSPWLTRGEVTIIQRTDVRFIELKNS